MKIGTWILTAALASSAGLAYAGTGAGAAPRPTASQNRCGDGNNWQWTHGACIYDCGLMGAVPGLLGTCTDQNRMTHQECRPDSMLGASCKAMP